MKNLIPAARRGPAPIPAALAGLGVCLGLVLAGGCRSGQGMSVFRSPLDERASIHDVMGPTERRLHAAEWEQRRSEISSSGMPLEGLEDYEAAQKLYDAGDYRAAEKAFHQLAKARGKAGKSWRDRWAEIFSRTPPSGIDAYGNFGDPIEEDALFMVAECQFARKEYSWAQDSYGRLLEKYPSTRHLDPVTRRLFHIARDWLGVPESAGEDDQIQLVSHAEDGAESPMLDLVRGPAHWPIVPNLFDRSRPVFDTDGRAMQALESIWQHDATGPLADDALMLQATYYQRKGDYVEAARLYALIREQYPDSSHFKDAYILGSHVTLASYSGPTYDGKTLEEAKQLKEQTRRLFADLSDEQKQRLDKDLDRIREAEVEREWAKVEFYQRKNQPASVALHCNQIIHRYPDSKFAKKAWDVLQRQQQQLDERRLIPGLMLTGRNSRQATESDAESQPDATAAAPMGSKPGTRDGAQPPQGKPRWRGFGNFLRPVEKPPQLQPVEPGRATLDDADPPAETEEERPARIFLN